VATVQVQFVQSGSVESASPDDLATLLRRDDGFVWIDAPSFDAEAEALIRRHFAVHPRVVEALRSRNHVPTVHAYEDHFFVVLHAPLLGRAGHVHLLELDVLVGRGFLITVHGPINPVVDPAEAMVETEAVRRRLELGRLVASSPMRVAYAVGSAIARRQRTLIGEVAERLPEVEQEVMSSQFREPEQLLEQLFLIRHELTTARTMAAQSHDVLGRVVAVDRVLDEDERDLVRDLADQFDRVRSIGDGESQFLFGVIDLYQTKVNTKMTVAMERLAVIAAVTLPITALSSIYGMNILDNRVHVIIVLSVMIVMSFLLLRWARRQGWW
jgi:magnesium transporter